MQNNPRLEPSSMPRSLRVSKTLEDSLLRFLGGLTPHQAAYVCFTKDGVKISSENLWPTCLSEPLLTIPKQQVLELRSSALKQRLFLRHMTRLFLQFDSTH